MPKVPGKSRSPVVLQLGDGAAPLGVVGDPGIDGVGLLEVRLGQIETALGQVERGAEAARGGMKRGGRDLAVQIGA